MGKTSIEWTDVTWNPITGCTEISPGCANCYAARLAATRLRNVPQYEGLTKTIAVTSGELKGNPPVAKVVGRSRWTGQIRFHEERLAEPLHWRKPRKVFVCDMADLFHESVDDGMLDFIFAQMVNCQQHTFQVLTKRPTRMREWCRKLAAQGVMPLPNVWLGVSVENQHFAYERIPVLMQTPAAVRFLSCEPLLESLWIGQYFRHPIEGENGIDWVICGGESGPNARPMHPEWARSLRNQCQRAGVPFFFKQWGEWAPLGTYSDPVAPNRTWTGKNLGDGTMMLRYGKQKAGRLLYGREWSEFPRIG